MMNTPDKKTPIKTGVPDHEDVNIVLKLYELRREPVMREARNTISFQWSPKNYEDFAELANVTHPKNAHFRQVSTYWEMAATFVNMGALHEELFWNTNGEAIFFYAKIAPFLERARKELMGPRFLVQLEELIRRRPDGADRLQFIQERQKKIAEQTQGKR
jgi:uncharacterized protein YozE (UPF0346 family)